MRAKALANSWRRVAVAGGTPSQAVYDLSLLGKATMPELNQGREAHTRHRCNLSAKSHGSKLHGLCNGMFGAPLQDVVFVALTICGVGLFVAYQSKPKSADLDFFPVGG